MIFGAHVVVYSEDAAADRAFSGGAGTFIGGRRPRMADLRAASRGTGGSPSEGEVRHELYFMCDDLKAEIAVLAEKASTVPKRRRHDGVRSPTSTPGEGAGLYSRSIRLR